MCIALFLGESLYFFYRFDFALPQTLYQNTQRSTLNYRHVMDCHDMRLNSAPDSSSEIAFFSLSETSSFKVSWSCLGVSSIFLNFTCLTVYQNSQILKHNVSDGKLHNSFTLEFVLTDLWLMILWVPNVFCNRRL